MNELKNKVKKQENQIIDMGNKFLSIVSNLNGRVIDLEAHKFWSAPIRDWEARITKLESTMIDSDVESMVWNIKSLTKEIDNLRSSKAPNIVQFQGVIFKDL